MPEPFPLFHWSPTSRHKQIRKRGLVPGCWSTDRMWKPPCVCYADSPSLAWALSGALPRGREHDSWDLWQTWSDVPTGFEELPYDDGGPRSGAVKEYRVYERVYARDLWYVGSRKE